MNPPGSLGVIGTGLIGASVGLRARELGFHVAGYDRNETVCREAQQLGALDDCISREALYDRCDIVVLAMHVSGTLRELDGLRRATPRASLILDVASVKAPVAAAAVGLPQFVASHPMAGAERSGPGAARATLFSGKPWLYVVPDDAAVHGLAVQFIASLGARPIAARAFDHDAFVALTSHLPQVLATLFAERLRARGGEAALDPYCGPTARELMRLSRSSLAMWRDILHANGPNIAAELRGLASDMSAAADSLERGETAPLERLFSSK